MKLGFGSWRFFLAFLVVISHLWEGMIHGPAAYAVWGFFALSGFLMTHVLQRKYGNTPNGLKDFAINRFLRIFPAYWIACVLGAIAVLVLPRYGIDVVALNPQFSWPKGWQTWLSNVVLIPLPVQGLFVPVSGALAVEVGAYVLMPLMAFSRPAAWLGLILSLLLNCMHGFAPGSFPVRYSSFLTAFWAFAFGALLVHYRPRLTRFEAPALSVLAWLANSLVWLWYDPWPWSYGLYFSVLLSGWVALSLAPRKSGTIDAWLGDLSYPVYLFHTVAGVFVWLLLPQGRTFPFFLASFLLTLCISWLVVVLVDRRLDELKRRKAITAEAIKTPSATDANGQAAR